MALTAAQTVTLLEILGLRGEPGTSERTTFDDAVTAAIADPGREDQLIQYTVDWAAISKAPVSTTGAKEYSTTRHRLEVRNKVAVVLGYPVLTLSEYELIVAGEDSSNAMQFVTISLGGLYGTGDEYSS
jgi:hypothetical protein